MNKKKLKQKIKELEKEKSSLQRETNSLRNVTEDKDIFFHSAELHCSFLEFMNHSVNMKDDIYVLMENFKGVPSIKASLTFRYEHMTRWLNEISKEYSHIRGVSGYIKKAGIKEVAQ